MRERERGGRSEKGASDEKHGGAGLEERVGGAVGRQSVEVTGLWSRRDVAGRVVGREKRRWRRTAVSRPRGK